MSKRFETMPRLYRYLPLEMREVKRADGDDGDDGETIDQRWIEILSHDKDAIDMSYMERGLSFLADHKITEVRGIVKGGRLDEKDKVLRGPVQFSTDPVAQQTKRDMRDGIRPYISVGYDPRSVKFIEEREGVEVWKVTRWTPMEASSVAVPADLAAGVGRSASGGEAPRMNRVQVEDSRAGEPMVEVVGDQGRGAREEGEMGAEHKPEKTAAEKEAEQRAAIAEIVEMCDAHGMSGKATEWIRAGLTPDQVSSEILKELRTQGKAQPAAEELAENTPDDVRKRFSYARAILCEVNGTRDGAEKEMHDECLKRMHPEYNYRGGILVPLRLYPKKQRALDTLTSGGAETVFDQPGELIEMLSAQTVLIRAGMRVLSGLRAPVPYAKKLTGCTVTWVGENPGSDVDETTPTYGLVTLMPKTMIGASSFSREQLTLSSVDSELDVKEDLSEGHALAVDLAGIHGKGSDGEPTGIYMATDVNIKAMGGVPTFGKLVDMIGAVADKNAHRGKLGFISTVLMAAKMMQTLVASSAGSNMIWTGEITDGVMCGYPAYSTTQVSKTLGSGSDEHGLIFGDYGNGRIGFWGIMELVVDPYSKKKQGLIEVASHQMADIILRHGQSFCKATGAKIA